ncbi:bolA-like protein 3 [Ischnura elegans]|uniref:bolA-like protein 3 n=1 Tax=Ischnura elegans TaxID=197161 RepID=UPI001ED896C7|nr:bolA-like protein 3 [Ischnura elegans]
MLRSYLLPSSHKKVFSLATRLLSGTKNLGENSVTNEKESLMKQKLKTSFPNAKLIEIVDISGGCGAMYEVTVDSSDFKGLSIVKQHRLVNEALKEEIKDMHGLRIHTSIP